MFVLSPLTFILRYSLARVAFWRHRKEWKFLNPIRFRPIATHPACRRLQVSDSATVFTLQRKASTSKHQEFARGHIVRHTVLSAQTNSKQARVSGESLDCRSVRPLGYEAYYWICNVLTELASHLDTDLAILFKTTVILASMYGSLSATCSP
ncbi:hypothetical protein C8Q79DRAFT_214058 [Trametes meyenii]|nr:hypothetical protein C8Q79DRAFT_214058 [Trametes meyenii]